MFWLAYSILVIINFLFSDANVVFVLTPADPFEAQEGSNVTLHWDYTGSNLLSLAWGVADGDNHLGTIIAQKHGNNDVQYSSSYRDRVLIEGRASLVIYNVKVSDSKRYGCQLTFQGQSAPIFSSVRLLVNGKEFYFALCSFMLATNFCGEEGVILIFIQWSFSWSGLNWRETIDTSDTITVSQSVSQYVTQPDSHSINTARGESLCVFQTRSVIDERTNG